MTGAATSRLGALPPAIDAHVWFEAHERKIFDLAAAVTKAVLSKDADLRRDAEQALGRLLEHAQLVLGEAAPVVLTRDGKHTIPYQEVAELRARVRFLSAELAALRGQPAQVDARDAGA